MVQVERVEHLGDYRIRVAFSDGAVKDVDLAGELWGEVFEPLRDEAYFRTGRYEPASGTIEWPNGADFAPEFLYESGRTVTGVSGTR